MGSYHQFCPVAKAMELLDERWTMLVVRELVTGSQHFNELRRGLPRISPTLLSKRLQQLVRAGVVDRQAGEGAHARYFLTPAGHELRSIVEMVGAWGIRWIGELGDPDLDPKLLLWDMRRNVNHDALPAGRTVVKFEFSDVAGRSGCWWLVITDKEADVCDSDPGFPVSVLVRTTLRLITDVWLGNITWERAQRSGGCEVLGPEPLRRALPGWFRLSSFASVPRPERGPGG